MFHLRTIRKIKMTIEPPIYAGASNFLRLTVR